MKTRIGTLVVVYSLTFCWWSSHAYGQAADADGLLDEIRAAMADRDLNVAKAKLEEAAKVNGSEEFTSQRERLRLLYDYLEGFWKSVDEGAKSLQAVEELMIGDVRVAVVEYQPGLLVLRVKGENRRYTVKTLPAKVALTLAERVLKPDAPENKVFFGAFLAMDGKGDREVARKLWSEAQQAKINVSALLPELGTAPGQLAGRDSAAHLDHAQAADARQLGLAPAGRRASRSGNAQGRCRTNRGRLSKTFVSH